MPLFLSADAFRAAFPGESEFVEFKQGIAADQIQQVAVAFSNVDGGVLLVGVAPDGRVVGVADSAVTRDRIHGALGLARQLGRYALDALDVDGSAVYAVAVARRREGTAQTNDGRVLVRRGTEKVPLFGDELLALMNARSSGRFEQVGAGVSLAEMDEVAVQALAVAYGWSGDYAARLRERGLVGEARDELTVAGALLLLAKPESVVPKAYVEIRRRSESGVGQFRLDVRGSIADQIQTGVVEIQRELGVESVIVGARRREIPPLPERVVREALVNALAHRSYEASGSAVIVEIAPGEVVITSPGGLPEPVTVANIRETKAARNPALIDALRRLRLADDEGVGVDRIFDDMRAELLEEPVFEDTGSHVIVRLPTRGALSAAERAWLQDTADRAELDAPDRILLVHAARGERLTNGAVRVLLRANEAEARRRLARLTSAGLLLRVGDRSATTYSIAPRLRVPLAATQAELEERIVQLASVTPVSNSTVREVLGIERAHALRLLARLVDDGRLARTGSRRGTRYVRAQIKGPGQ